MNYPKLTIITPSFNCGQYIEQTILSVLNQDYENIEYFVIDGQSTDNTIDILKKLSQQFPDKFKWISEPDEGQTDAINKGLKMCSGDWFAWLNADDYYEPNVLKKIAEQIKNYPNAGVIYGNCFDVDESGNKIKYNKPSSNVNFKTLKKGNQIYGPSSFFKIEEVKKTDGFNINFHIWMDYDMYIQISKNKLLQYINLDIANFRIRQDQKSRGNEYKLYIKKEKLEIKKKYYPSLYLFTIIHTKLNKLMKLIKKIPFVNFISKKIRSLILYFIYLKDFKKYKSKKINQRFDTNWKNRYPCIHDKTKKTGFCPHYTYHPAWAARILAETEPKKHIDISSKLYFSTMVSAFIPVEFYDIRPANITLTNLLSKKADLLKLPFPDNSVESLSCMHTIEHIGLGRYGDEIDPDGDLKAIAELKRVLANQGNLLFVVPIGKPKLMFNAHRIYSYEQVLEYFNNYILNNFALITDKGEFLKDATKELADQQNYGCGCFWFQKQL